MTRRRTVLFLCLGALLVLTACLLFGTSGIGLPDLTSPSGRAILGLRTQRVAAGFIIGAALACSGVILQALLRNPLAEPYVLGVSSGAGLGAAIAILSGFASSHLLGLPGAAFAGSAIALALVYGLGHSAGRLSMYGLILSGVIVSAICSSLLMFLITIAPVEGVHSVVWWMLGNLQAPPHALFAVASSLIVVGMLVAWSLSRELNALVLGSEMAHHVGIRTGAAVTIGLVTATLMTSAAVSMSGLIGFVGLIVPHVVRSITGPNHRTLLPASALAGGVFLAVCDAIARTVIAPVEIPVGVVTALLGGPFFIVILRQHRKRVWMG